MQLYVHLALLFCLSLCPISGMKKKRGFDSCLLIKLVLMVMMMVVGKAGVPKNEGRGMMEMEKRDLSD